MAYENLSDDPIRHLALGREAMSQNNYAQAVTHFEVAYHAQADPDTAQWLASALQGVDRFRESLDVLAPFQRELLQTPEGTKLMFSALLGEHEFLQAWQLSRVLSLSAQRQWQAKITDAEQAYHHKDPEVFAALQRQLRHLGGSAIVAQEQLLAQIGPLGRSGLIGAVAPALVDPDVHIAFRVNLLDWLVMLQVAEPVALLGYQQTLSVTPKVLPRIEKDPTSNKVMDEIAALFVHGDTVLGTDMMQLAQVELSYLYPDVSSIIPDARGYAKAYVAFHQGEQTAFDDLLSWQSAQTQKLAE